MTSSTYSTLIALVIFLFICESVFRLSAHLISNCDSDTKLKLRPMNDEGETHGLQLHTDTGLCFPNGTADKPVIANVHR